MIVNIAETEKGVFSHCGCCSGGRDIDYTSGGNRKEGVTEGGR